MNHEMGGDKHVFHSSRFAHDGRDLKGLEVTLFVAVEL